MTEGDYRHNCNLRFALLPADNEDTASSRIRVFIMQRALTEMGVSATVGYTSDADVLFVQKKVTKRTLRLAEEAKARGRTVFYDVDDLGDALWFWAPRPLFRKMVQLADAVLTATPEQRDQLRVDFGVPRVDIVPCAIDYDPAAPHPFPPGEAGPLRVLWFGNNSNLDLLQRYAQALSSLDDVQLVIVTNADAMEYLSARYPGAEIHAWNRTGFVSVLQSCHLTCLMHDGSDHDRAKSNNRMVTSITWGVPAVVSRTPEYERTAVEAMVPHSVFTDETELLAAIQGLRSAEARRAYLAVAQPVIWQRYAPRSVAAQFLRIAAAYAQPRDGQGSGNGSEETECATASVSSSWE